MQSFGKQFRCDFLSARKKGIAALILKITILGIKLRGLLRGKVRKTHDLDLRLLNVSVGIGRFIFQHPLAESVKSASFSAIGNERVRPCVHPLSRPQRRVMVSPFVIPQQRNFGYAKDLSRICKNILYENAQKARLNKRQPGMGIITYVII